MTGRHVRALRIGGGRGAVLTFADQMISSASNFMLGVIIARAGGAEALGTFGVAFLLWLGVVGANRALVTEPMTVTGSTDPRDAQIPEGLLATLVLAVGAALVLGGAGLCLQLSGVKGTALMALSVWIPSLLAQDYCRSMAFRMRRPDHALVSDATFAVVQVAISGVLFAVGSHSTAAFVAAWGLGATAGAVAGVLTNGTRLQFRGGLRHLRVLWPRSRWFLAEFGTAFPADQGYLLLLPILLGTAQFGFYRSGAGLVGPVVVILIAGGNIGLPESVRKLRDHGLDGLDRYAKGLTAAVLGITVVYCAFVALLAEPLLQLVYGRQFTGAATITRLIAIQYVLMAASFGFGQAVKAAGQMRLLWASRTVSAILSISAVTVLAGAFGLIGAGVASMTAGCVYSLGVAFAYLKMRRSHAEQPAAVDGPGDADACTAPEVAQPVMEDRGQEEPAIISPRREASSPGPPALHPSRSGPHHTVRSVP
jgi:O-antigen/teichoic acid export membrane protein